MALLSIKGLTKTYTLTQGFLGRTTRQLTAVDAVDLEVRENITLGLVGESGCGKSTCARMIVKLLAPTSGTIMFGAQDVTRMSQAQFRPLRRDIQIVFQDPYSSLSPRLKVKTIIAEPLEAFKESRATIMPRVIDLLRQVGLNERHAERYPFELSGGERQRVGIARALATSPKLLVLDEAVSSLDVSTQAQILNLLSALKAQYALSYLFIAHNLEVVRYISDEVAVMYRGMIVEQGPTAQVYHQPGHPYTRLLLQSRPSMRTRSLVHSFPRLSEDVSQTTAGPGCCCAAWCTQKDERCNRERPAVERIGDGHWVRCYKQGTM